MKHITNTWANKLIILFHVRSIQQIWKQKNIVNVVICYDYWKKIDQQFFYLLVYFNYEKLKKMSAYE